MFPHNAMLRKLSRARLAATTGILGFWLVMTTWLVAHEVGLDGFRRPTASYRTLLDEAPVAMDSWMRILHGGRTVGFARQSLDTRERDPATHQVITQQLFLRLTLFGVPQMVTATAEVALDVWRQLQRFDVVLRAGGRVFRAHGKRSGKQIFDVSLEGVPGLSRGTVEIPDQAMLDFPMMGMMLKRMRPGDRLSWRALDPFTLKPADVRVEAERWESLTLTGRPTRALALRVTAGKNAFRAWMDAEGRMLRQETPLGWTMEICTPDEALRGIGERASEGRAEVAPEGTGLFDWLTAERGPTSR